MASAAGALALGVAGSAFACAAADFTGTAACQQSSGNALLTIKDSDGSRTHATVEIDYNGQKVGSVEFHATRQDKANTQTVVVPWETSGSWTLTAQADNYNFGNNKPKSIPVPGGDCGQPSTPPSQSASPSESAPASESASASASASESAPASASASASESSSAPVVVPSASASASSSVEATTSPSASTAVEATASPTGTVLASTGGGSDAGLFAGIGAVLVAAGGATVFFLRRRAAGSHA
ncbi:MULTISPECIES: LAETG motif-containing sortase-dependent surface protein [Streptacidiphilus]|uniref:LAETG motif-containing sortase-dependent surface protein n=1 Tax=Streptacidiphilus cavernicola TaxID=3342716 RepID=A0ABV6UM04_9ACTN|nr:LAETG motif-containing sortase-dependent surface protein [Streptacidiphilus jeojiense]